MAETYRKHLYCEMSFLEQCVSQLNEFHITIDNINEYQALEKTKSILLCPDVKLHLDMSFEDYEAFVRNIEKKRKTAAKKGNDVVLSPLEQVLFDINLKQLNNEIHLKLSRKIPDIRNFQPSSDEELNALYFTTASDDDCRKASDKYGILVVNRNNIMVVEESIQEKGSALHKNDIFNWGKALKRTSFPCNSLTIVDNYVLNDTEMIKCNLKDILDAILPERLCEDIPFQLLIMTTLRKDKRQDLDSDSRFRLIMDILSGIRPDLTVQLCIVKNGGDLFHDRTIITNYAYIECGAGFDIIKSKISQKTTTIKSYGLYLRSSTKWLTKAYENLLLDIYTVYKSTPERTIESMPNFFIGTKSNRIMDEMEKIQNRVGI